MMAPIADGEQPISASSRKRKPFVLLLILLVVVSLGTAYWRLTAPPPQIKEASNDFAPVAVDDAETPEGKVRRQLLGVWQDEYKGKRTMTLKEDGTGTMLVELSGAQAFLFAPKLHFDMKWSLEGKTFKKKTVGGQPADQVNMILNTMGDTAEDAILEVTETRLLLLDKDGETKYDWRRVKTDEPPRP